MPGRIGSPTPARLGEPGQQPVDQRPVGVAGARVHDQPGRLVDDDDVVVGVDDVEHHGRVGDRAVRSVGITAGSTSTSCAFVEAHLARGRRRAVDADATGCHGGGGSRAADVGQQGDHPVEPLAGEGGGDALADHRASCCSPAGPAGPPVGRLGRRRPRRRLARRRPAGAAR